MSGDRRRRGWIEADGDRRKREGGMGKVGEGMGDGREREGRKEEEGGKKKRRKGGRNVHSHYPLH